MKNKNSKEPLTLDSVLMKMSEIFSDDGRDLVLRELRTRLVRDQEEAEQVSGHPAAKAGDK